MTFCTDFSFFLIRGKGKKERRIWCFDKIETDDDNHAVLKVYLFLSFFLSFFLSLLVGSSGKDDAHISNTHSSDFIPGHPFSCAYFKHSR